MIPELNPGYKFNLKHRHVIHAFRELGLTLICPHCRVPREPDCYGQDFFPGREFRVHCYDCDRTAVPLTIDPEILDELDLEWNRDESEDRPPVDLNLYASAIREAFTTAMYFWQRAAQ